MDSYNLAAFEKKEQEFKNFRDILSVGSRAPKFIAWTLEREEVRLSDFKGKSHLVLEFGSIT